MVKIFTTAHNLGDNEAGTNLSIMIENWIKVESKKTQFGIKIKEIKTSMNSDGCMVSISWIPKI